MEKYLKKDLIRKKYSDISKKSNYYFENKKYSCIVFSRSVFVFTDRPNDRMCLSYSWRSKNVQIHQNPEFNFLGEFQHFLYVYFVYLNVKKGTRA